MFMSAFNVKVRVLYRDWLICETYSLHVNTTIIQRGRGREKIVI